MSMVSKILSQVKTRERAYMAKTQGKFNVTGLSLFCSGNGYIFSDQGNSGKSFSGSKCVGECAADDGGRIWITSAGIQYVTYVASVAEIWDILIKIRPNRLQISFKDPGR